MKSNSGAIRGLAIGITGGIACGKSEVARAFSALGAETADADVLAHEAIRPGEPAYDRVVARFGREIVGPGGEVDRRRLGEVVFQRPAERAALEAIIHPEVIKALKQWVNEVTARGAYAAATVPLLYEVNLVNLWDSVVCVRAPVELVIRRLRARGLTEEMAKARIAAQMPVEEKAKKADYVIENSGSLQELSEQARSVWNDLLRKGAQ